MVSSRVSPAGEQGHVRRKFQTEDSAIEAKMRGGEGGGGKGRGVRKIRDGAERN